MAEIPRKYVLVAEDSAVTQDILKLVLLQRGHDVDIAGDGAEALVKLRDNNYDIALVDFHLPNMTGLEAVNKYLAHREGKEIPRIVAMTGDPKGLLSSSENCENFDLVVSKPIEFDEVQSLVEAEESTRRIHKNRHHHQKSTNEPHEEPYAELGLFQVLFPRDICTDDALKRLRTQLNTLGPPDLIIFEEAPLRAQLKVLTNLKHIHLSPVLDLTGSLGHRADISTEKGLPGVQMVQQIVDDFADRRRDIHDDFLKPEDLREKLLARTFLAQEFLQADYAPFLTSWRSYNTILDPRDVAQAAKTMTKEGILRAEFFDRFYVCPSCRSSRLAVREECTACRSTQLHEESYLHHYRCAWQAPETEFRQDDELVCPNCHRALTHFGQDYDKPGSMLICSSCGHAGTDPAVGFLCVDCGVKTDGEAITTTDVHHFRLTDRGRELAQAGRMVVGSAHKVFRFTDLPLDLTVALNAAARRYSQAPLK